MNAFKTGVLLTVGLLSLPVAAEEALDVGLRYVNLEPGFVTNYGYSDSGRLAYIRTDVSVQVNSQAAENAVIYHTPALRNFLVLALSRQDEDAVSTTEGRDNIRMEAMEEIREYLSEEEGETFVEDILFTNFIVQR